MSRCFPYPPPGYEPRPRSEHKDLLKKERRKGKKHRQENGREKGGGKGKDKDHKKLQREKKRRERRKNRDRDKNNHQNLEQETQKTDYFGNRRPKERKKHQIFRDDKCLDDNLMQMASFDETKFTSDGIKKRKELDANSASHENGMKTNKLPRMSPTNITRVNGKTSPHSQRIAPCSSTELVCGDTREVDQQKPQDGYSDGIGSHCLEQQKVSVSLSVYDSNEGYIKPPHPDTKYLTQLQSVPPTPREDTSECIDQDWLFLEDPVERKTASFEAAESHQVWSDVQLIDTADVVALPYVVPL